MKRIFAFGQNAPNLKIAPEERSVSINGKQAKSLQRHKCEFADFRFFIEISLKLNFKSLTSVAPLTYNL